MPEPNTIRPLAHTVFTGDNLHVLRGMNSDSVDLIYLDPPFNSNKSYSAPIGGKAAGAAFKDTWTLDDVDLAWHGEIAAHNLGRRWIGIDISPMAHKLVKMRLERDLGVFSLAVNHRTDVPRRTDLGELPDYRTHKHTLYGRQEGVCTGCNVHFPFRNLTIDHLVPRAKGGSNHSDNLQLLCGACHSMKGTDSQAHLTARLKARGVIRGSSGDSSVPGAHGGG